MIKIWNDTTNITVLTEPNEPKNTPSNHNVSLCGTCPKIPYNIAPYFCEDCKKNICSDCRKESSG